MAKQISPTRSYLPHWLIVPWWMVFVVLGVTAVVSVSYSVGEEPKPEHDVPHENQEFVDDDTPIDDSEEGTLIQQLQARIQELEKWEQRLQQKEERLAGLQKDVEALAERQVQEAERLTKKAEKLKAEEARLDARDPSLDRLVKVYDAMDPEEAALRVAEMEQRLALEILSGIKDKKAAAVLAGVPPDKAAELSLGLRKFRKR